MDQLKSSISQFGFVNPMLIDPDGIIIAGHARWQAALELGLPAVPTIVLPHLSEAQKRALMLADNKLALNAGWDEGHAADRAAGTDARIRHGDPRLRDGYCDATVKRWEKLTGGAALKQPAAIALTEGVR